MDEEKQDEYVNQLMHARLKVAAGFLERLPHFPPNVAHMEIKFHYDDGYHLELDISQESESENGTPKKANPVLRRIKSICRIGS